MKNRSLSHFNFLSIFLFTIFVFFVPVTCITNMPLAETLEGISIDDSSMGLSLEKLLNLKVTTATLTEIDMDKAPAAMSVITEKEIRRSGARNIFELLDKVRGIQVQSTNLLGSIKSINIRGTTSSYNKMKILLDGHDIQDPHFDEQSIPLALENVKQVEIIRGPGSCLYGANAFAGVINIITKTAADIDGTHFDVKYGSFNAQQIDLSYGNTFDMFDLQMNINYADSEDYDAVIEKDGAYGSPVSLSPGKSDAGKHKKVNGSFGIRYNQLKINFAYFDSKGYSAINLLGFLSQDGDYSQFKYGYMVAEYDFPESERFKAKLKCSYDHRDYYAYGQALPDGFKFGRDAQMVRDLGIDVDYDANGDGIFENFPDGAFIEQGYKTSTIGSELICNYVISDDNLLTGGLFYQLTQSFDHFYETDLNPAGMYRVIPFERREGDESMILEVDRTIYGLFLQDQWDITEDWYLVLGARYDYYDDVGETLNPRLSLTYTFDYEHSGIVKFIYGTAFKAPTFVQMYFVNTSIATGNPELEPEKITSYEVNLGYLFFDKLKTNFSVYQLHTDNLIDSYTEDPNRPYLYVNQNKRKTWGVETQFRYVIEEAKDVYIAYDYTDAKNDITDEGYPFMPDTQISCGFNWHAWRYFNWNVNLDYVGKMKRQPSDTRDDFDPQALIDTTVMLENYKGWDIYISVYNVTDEDRIKPTPLSVTPLASQISDIPLPGREFTVGLRVKF